MGSKTMRILGIVMAFSFVFAIPIFAQNIETSSHNFSSASWNSNADICSPCHTPHNATAVTDAPLWSRAAYTATYTPYTNADTLNATTSGAVTGVTQLCLSCHDGQVALDVFGNDTDTVTGNANVGLDLSDDHPVNFTYDDDLANEDGGLVLVGGDNDVGGLPLYSGSLECATCHDVHNEVGNTALLRIANTGSDLCLTCHNK